MGTLVWFTHDLRISDNPALHNAVKLGDPILAVYLVDQANPAAHTGAALWWLHYSLTTLNQQLKSLGGSLLIHQGDTQSLLKIAQKYDCSTIHFSCSHEPWLADQQKQLHLAAQGLNITCRQFAGQLLNEPNSVFTKQGNPFQVFTPYYRACLAQMGQPQPLSMHTEFSWSRHSTDANKELKKLGWLPKKPNWANSFSEHWQPGEQGAHKRLQEIIEQLKDYNTERDFPSLDATSCLSPHLHFGEISPREVWQTVSQYWPKGEAAAYLRQLIWRDFSYYLINHFPHMLNGAFKKKFDKFPWKKNNSKSLKAWKLGQTGYPLVDAGMRQLWQTGWMHNRVRMVVASFLTKHLQLHWKLGADWFWDTLLDADLANNTAGWQWVAGCGADAAPYFRIFNPTMQSEKFDKNGHYIRTYVPELAQLPDKYIHAPWLAPEDVLKKAGITLGETYPKPIVDHKTAREDALTSYSSLNKVTPHL